MPHPSAHAFALRKIISLLGIAVIWALASIGYAQSAPQINGKIDPYVRMRLQERIHPLANPQNDRGVVTADLPMERMLLVLKRPATQAKALEAAIDAMYRPGSPAFHKWMTPGEIGTKYGPAQTDVDKVTAWLQQNGFAVSSVSKARSVIEFTGTAQMVTNTFHAEIHQYAVNGRTYIANSGIASIPAALSPVVAGFASLNNFPRAHMDRQPGVLSFNKATKKWSAEQDAAMLASGKAKPQLTININGISLYPVGPADFAQIYNLKPLWDAGIDGTGQHIAVVSESNITTSDVDNFRAVFGLPPTNLKIILNGTDPGLTMFDESEATLDAEWAGVAAKNATVDFVISKTTSTSAGVDLSALYIIDNQVAPVMTESYGACEGALGVDGNLFYYQLWQQAAAQGITAILASGDAGSAACDEGASFAIGGESVSGFASTPYTLTVGGTDFAVSTTDPSTYWSDTNDPATLQSALSYIPEVPWNSSCASPDAVAIFGGQFGATDAESLCNNATAQPHLLAVVGGGGGASNCAEANPSDPSQCGPGYGQPAWQQGIYGIPDSKARYLPDVSLFASNGLYGSFYLFCEADVLPSGVCDFTDPTTVVTLGAGGTSFAAPAFAGIMALVNQKTGSSQGLANYVLYDLGRKQYGTTGAPSSTLSACSAASVQSGNSCVFYDVTQGSNAMPCFSGTQDCVTKVASDSIGILPGYVSTAGFDPVTGLGTVNVFNLVNRWASSSIASDTTSLVVSHATSTYGQAVTISGKVTPASGAGTPSGEVVIQGSGTTQGSINLVSGSFSAVFSTLPSGAYALEADYLGDGAFSKSTSPKVSIVVSQASSSGTLTYSALDPYTQTVLSATNQIPYGTQTTASFAVQGVTGVPGILAPTGSVSFTSNSTTLGTVPVSGSTAVYTQIAAVIGDSSMTATYLGDSNYLPSPAVTANYSVIKGATALETHPGVSAVSGSGTVTLNAIVTTMSVAAPPTGKIFFSINGTQVASAAIQVSGYDSKTSRAYGTVTVNVPTSRLQAGTNVLTASYSGDGNYNSSTAATTSITYGTGSIPSAITLGASATAVSNTTPVAFTAAISNGGNPASVGIVTFLDGSKVLAKVPVVGINPAAGANTGSAKLLTVLPDGTHSITAVYGGVSGVIPSATSATVTVSVTGTLPTLTSISAIPSSTVAANYDVTAQLFAGGTVAPTGNVGLTDVTLGVPLAVAAIDPSTAQLGFAPERTLQIGGFTGLSTTGDFNGDGIPDLAVTKGASFNPPTNGTGDSQLVIFLGKGDGSFQAGLPLSVTNDPNLADPYGIVTGDFNGDGIQDLALSFQSGTVMILLGNGDGSFRTGQTISAPGFFATLFNLVVGDFNRDGIQDLAVADFGSSKLDILLGNGDGTFQDPTQTSTSYPTLLGLADLNKDGKDDLVVLHPYMGEVGVLLGNGDGTFQTEVEYAAGLFPWGLAVGDLNKDGYPDVVVTNEQDGTASVLINDRSGAFGGVTAYSVGGFPQSVAIGDVNHDGNADVVVGNNSGNSLSILYGDGSGALRPATTLATGATPLGILLTDLNNDGVLDIVVNENQAGTTGVILNGTSLTVQFKNVAVTGLSSEPQSVTGTYLGDSHYSASISAPVTLAGSGIQAPTSMVWSPSVTGEVYGNTIPNGVFNAQVANNVAGTIVYTAQLTGGAATPVTSATVLPSAGLYTLTATFTPANPTDYAGSTAQAAFSVTMADISQVLSASTAKIPQGASVTFTDQVKSTTSGTPTGVVAFYSGADSIGAAVLDASGEVSITTSSLPTGTLQITAAYLGNDNFKGATSAAFSETVTAADFAIASSPSSASVTAGQAATYALTLTPNGNFDGVVSFSCSGLPSLASCSFSPATLTPGASAKSTTLTITTTGTTTAASLVKPARNNRSTLPVYLAIAPLGLSMWFFLGDTKRRNRSRKVLLVAAILIVLAFMAACGGSHPKTIPGTPTGTSTVTITATDGAVTHTTTVTLTVQ